MKLNRKGQSILALLLAMLVSALLFSLYISIKSIRKEKAENNNPPMSQVKTAEDCEQFWQKSLKQQLKSEDNYYVPAIISISNSLLYQNCLKRFEKK